MRLCLCVRVLQSPVDIVTGGMSPIRDLDRLLQDMDINRLRAVVFRDIVSLFTQYSSSQWHKPVNHLAKKLFFYFGCSVFDIAKYKSAVHHKH